MEFWKDTVANVVVFGVAVLFVYGCYIGTQETEKAYAATAVVNIAVPDTVVGALKEEHKLTIYANGKEYAATTPFWVRVGDPNHLVLEATRIADGKFVRLYWFSMSNLFIEEELPKKGEK